MKKSLAVLLFLTTFLLFANTSLQAAKIPAAVESAFKNQYPTITNVKWSKEKKNFEAEFQLNGVKTNVMYDAAGNLVQTELDMPITSIPEKISTYIKTNYPNKSIKEFSKITDAGGNISYEVEFSRHELLFQADGTFLRELK